MNIPAIHKAGELDDHLDKVKSVYDQIGQKFYDVFVDLTLTRKSMMKFFEDCRMDLKDGYHVLDAGIGSGMIAEALIKGCDKQIEVHGFDISKQMLQQAKKVKKEKKLEELTELKQACACTLPYKNNYFDFVVSNGMLEYMSNVQEGLNELVRVIKPGKRVLIFAIKDNIAGKLTGFLWQSGTFDKNELKRFMQQAGLTDITTYRFKKIITHNLGVMCLVGVHQP